MNLKVNEIFYSLQGEGMRTGQASIFIRLSGCNLNCSFCDTEFNSGEYMSLEEILKEIEQYNCKWIVWTGGEPCLQLTEEILEFFKKARYKQAVETNGTILIPVGFDYITCSPKFPLKLNRENFAKVGYCVNEIKFVIQSEDVSRWILKTDGVHCFAKCLSPVFEGDEKKDLLNMNIVNACVEYIKQNSTFGLSIQIHKLLNIK